MGRKPKVVAIVQARMGSSRLPGKMLMDVAGKPLLARTLERAKAIPDVDVVVLATTTAQEDRGLLALAEEVGVVSFAGSEEDVLDRYCQAVKRFEGEAIMRLTGDCPLLDPWVCHDVLARFLEGDVDYVSNTNPPTYPDGLDTEVFTPEALEIAWREATLKTDREHVTQFIVRHPQRFRIANVAADTDLSHWRWTVDEAEDLHFVRKVYQGLARRGWHGHRYSEVMRVIEEDALQDTSHLFRRNEGLMKTMREDGLLSPGDETFRY